MSLRLSLSLAIVLALGGIGGVRAQSAPGSDKAVLPLWNNASGKVEAVLVLEPTSAAEAGGRFRFGNNSLDATFGLDAGDSLALLCDRKSGIAAAVVLGVGRAIVFTQKDKGGIGNAQGGEPQLGADLVKAELAPFGATT